MTSLAQDDTTGGDTNKDRTGHHAGTGIIVENLRIGLTGQPGVDVVDDSRGTLPFTVRGAGRVRGGQVVIDASASSQFVSALLLAVARHDEGVDVRHHGAPVPSPPHPDITVACLRAPCVEEETS